MAVDENKIKQKIELDGEKEYKQALNDAYRGLKTLRSELKAETAELGANATAQQKNEVRMKSLQKQIKEQEKIVRTYKKALEEVKEKYSDNEEEVAKWEQKLNNARATLANMKNDLEDVNGAFKEMQSDANMATVASRSVAESLQSIADVGGTVSDSIEGIFTGMLSFVKETITDIWAEVVDLAARSNGLVDLAGYWNTDVTTIQKYKGAVESVSGTLEDLSSIVTKINMGDSKKIAELTGVSKELYKDEWEYAMAVMGAMSRLDHEARNNAGIQIFGKQATKSFDLLNDWSNLLTELDKFDVTKGGFGLTSEELQQMSDLYDDVNKLHASWKSLKDMATVKLFGQLSMDLTGNAQAIVDGFLEYFNADSDQERDEALKKITDNIIEMFETAKQAILDGIALLDGIVEELKGSDNPAAQTIGGILGGLVDALKWLTEDNMRNVVTALEILAAFWLVGKGAQMAATIAGIVKNITLIKAFSGAGAAAGAAGAEAAAGAGAAGGLWAILKKAAPWAIGAGIVINDSLNNHGDENQWTEEEIEEIRKLNNWDPWENQVTYGLAKVDVTDEQRKAAEDFWDVYRQNPTDFSDEAWDAFESAFAGQEELFNKVNDLMDYLTQADRPDDWWTIEDLPANWWLHGNETGEGITNENLNAFNNLPGKMEKAVAKAVSGIRVEIDGQYAGRILAPYVSQEIATEV